MNNQSLAVTIRIDDRYPPEHRLAAIESAMRDLTLKLSTQITDGKQYYIQFRRQTEREQFGIREMMRFDIEQVNTIHHVMYGFDGMDDRTLIGSTTDELKSRVRLGFRKIVNRLLSKFGIERKRL